MKQTLFWLWLTMIALLTGSALLIALTVQQNYRQSANDPQMALSADLATQLKAQTVMCDNINLNNRVDITTSLTPFIDVYNASGQAINVCLPSTAITAPTGQANGQLPRLPSGVFAFTQAHGHDRFTWEPASGGRFAVVVTYYHGANSGFVLAARNLQEVESREHDLAVEILVAWLVGVIVLTAGFGLAARASKNR